MGVCMYVQECMHVWDILVYIIVCLMLVITYYLNTLYTSSRRRGGTGEREQLSGTGFPARSHPTHFSVADPPFCH